MTRPLRLLGRASATVLLALGLAELGMRAVDGFAFPHLNVYEADAELGTRLRPGATERVAFGGNPATDVRINSSGFRGADWGPPAEGEIVVVGDSQVFGLGVEEADTLPAQLAVATGRPVVNAGVPTYGPDEYLAVIERLLAERHPETVVAVLNFSNDLFERDRPNRERHKVWDGWAVRAETMPRDVTDFPGRSWLFRESHLAFALRRALYRSTDTADLGVNSEGGVEDLLVTATPAADPMVPESQQRRGPEQAAEPAGDGAGGESVVLTAAAEAESVARERRYAEESMLWLLTRVDPAWKYEDRVAAQAVVDHNQPGDIVYEREAEGSRGVPVTAELLARGAKMRKAAKPTLEAWLAAHPNPKGQDAETARAARDALQSWAENTERLARLATVGGATSGAAPSALGAWVAKAAAVTEAAGAELVVVALPLDVQVSAEEWAKYGKEPVPMEESRALLDDLVLDAHARGLRALSLVDSLAAAEPGAFLHADLHLSPKGTRAAAAALAATLAAPAPVVRPGPGYAPGRSAMPAWDEAALADEITVAGSTRNRCSTRRVREWFVMDCAPRTGNSEDTGAAPELDLVDAPLESAWARRRDGTSLLVPLVPGYDVTVDLRWPKAAPLPLDTYTRGLREVSATALDITGALGGTAAPAAAPTADAGSARTEALMADDPWREGRHEALTVRWKGDKPTIRFESSARPFEPEARAEDGGACFDTAQWGEGWLNERRGCAASWSDCIKARSCARGIGPAPTCGEDEAPIGATGWCYALCDDAHPCAEGRCTAWEGGHVCL